MVIKIAKEREENTPPGSKNPQLEGRQDFYFIQGKRRAMR
jgi:hypothetical protein